MIVVKMMIIIYCCCWLVQVYVVVVPIFTFKFSALLGGAKIPQDRVVDGKDIADILFDRNASSPHTYLFFWNGVFNDHKLCAVRYGSFKVFDGDCSND